MHNRRSSHRLTSMSIEFICATDTGRARANNEDSIAQDADVGLAVLADGMGGYAAGEVAAGMATSFIINELGRWLRDSQTQASDADVRRAMDICVDNANRAIFNAANANAQYAGMGTTLIVSVFRGDRVLMGHIGDSRVYRWRKEQLEQITRDHSLLQEQIDAGLLTPAQAQFSANRNLVTRAVGVEDAVALETHLHELQDGDVFLLCSDGLSDMLPDDQIADILSLREENLAEASTALINAANEAGGRDNISVILTRVNVSSSSPTRSWWPFRR